MHAAKAASTMVKPASTMVKPAKARWGWLPDALWQLPSICEEHVCCGCCITAAHSQCHLHNMPLETESHHIFHCRLRGSM
jgi:hypothetical protein